MKGLILLLYENAEIQQHRHELPKYRKGVKEERNAGNKTRTLAG